MRHDLATCLCAGHWVGAGSDVRREREPQQGRGGRGGFGMMGGGTAGLVMMKPVQEELKLTSDQTSAVTKIAEDAMEAGRESFGNLRGASQEERREAMEKMQKQSAETDKKIAAALKPEQAARLKELAIQRRGVAR